LVRVSEDHIGFWRFIRSDAHRRLVAAMVAAEIARTNSSRQGSEQ
jgi:hypothetical protein